MADTNEVGTPSTPVTDQKPDYFINSIQGMVPSTLNDMHAQGMYANNFSMEEPDAYWSKKAVKTAFTDPQTGKERRDLFDAHYKDVLSRYKTHRDTELNLVNFDQFPNITAERSGLRTPTPLVFKTKEDPQGRNYQSGYAFTDPLSTQTQSLKETAIDTGVLTGEGKYVPTKDFSGKAKFAMGEKGGLLFNDDGRPYLVPVKDGEQLHQWDLIYSPTAEKLGSYSADYTLKNVAASIVKNPINAFSQAVDDMIEYGRGFLGFWGLDSEDTDKSINRVENWAKSMRAPTTEKNEGDFLNMENTIDISQQVLWQLGLMAAVGGTIGALTKNPKAASIGAKLFMAALSGGSAAEYARDNGLSKRETAVLIGLQLPAYYHLQSLSEAALGYLGTQESRAAIAEGINKVTNGGALIKQLAANPSKSLARNIFTGLKENAKSLISKSTVYKLEQKAPLLVGAGSEAIEEGSEQVLDLMGREAYNAYDYTKDEDSRHPFHIDWRNELAQLGQQAAGGAIGGAAAHSIFSRMLNNHPEVATSWNDLVMDGKEATLRRFISDMHTQGRLDHNWLTGDGKITKPEAGNSRNDETKNILNGVVDYLVELRDTSGIKELYKKNREAAKAIFNETTTSPLTVASKAGEQIIRASSIGKDVSTLVAKVSDLNSRLDKAKTSSTPNTKEIADLSEELKVNQEALQKIVKGDFVADYVTEGLYNTLALTSQDEALKSSKLSGKEFNALLNSIPEQHKASQEAYKVAQQAQEEADQKATIETPEGASESRVKELLGEAKSEYEAQHRQALPHIKQLSQEQDETTGEPLVYEENLHPGAESEIRNSEVEALKNTTLPAIKEKQPKPHSILSSLVNAAEKLRKIEQSEGIAPTKAPSTKDNLLNMTEGEGSLIVSSPTPITAKISDELALRAASTSNGISVYSNSPQLSAIKNSIEKRIAQTKALQGITPELQQVRKAHSLPEIPEIAPEELTNTLVALENMLGVTNALLDESNSNLASADLKIAKAVSRLLGNSMDYINALSEASIGTPFAGIQAIVSSYRPAIAEALGRADNVEVLKQMNKMESAIYNDHKSQRDEILNILSSVPRSDLAVRTYDYARGVLSLSSSDFWNAYHSVLTNSNSGIFSPSDEHSIVIKQAVQGLMADKYSPPNIGHPNRILHNNSVFIEGRGGTAKTKTMIPAISGIVQTLTGGKVFLTAAKDFNDFKRSNLINAVETFYRINDKQLGIQLASSSKDIVSFLDTPGATTDVNLIVYDEGTLLSTDDLANIQSRLDRLNRQRRDSGSPLLKVLYTGDTLQNSIGVDKSNPDGRALGIDDENRHVLQRTPALTFSFRQTNQQLTLFASYLEGVQKEKGTSRPFSTEYRSREGVEIHQGYDSFLSGASSYLNSLSKQGRLDEAVYITDKGPFETDQRILDSKVLILTSEQAQGREWPVVFFDPKISQLFSPNFTNLGVKKDYYTAATRASNYLMTHVTPGQGITSSEGQVNKVRPLSPEKVTRQATIDKVSQILDNLAAPVSKVAFDYTAKNVYHSGEDFPMEDEATQAQGQSPIPEKPEVAKPPVATVLTQGTNLQNYLNSINRGDLVSMHTFYTNALHDFDTQLDLKRKAIYDFDARKTIPYFISINRIGSQGYENVLRNNPELVGTYALFLEAGPAENNVILGVLSTPGLDEAIKSKNLLAGKEAVRIPIHSGFLSEMENIGTTVVNKLKKVHSVGNLKQVSKGIRFGAPYVVTTSSSEVNIKGEPKMKAGQIFVPSSFNFTEDKIGEVLKDNNSSPYITKVPVRTTSVPFQEVVSRMEPFLNEDGVFDFTAQEKLAGRMYDAFWSHNAESGEFATEKPRESRLSEAFKSLRDQTRPSDPFYSFLDSYVEKEIIESPEDISDDIVGTKFTGKSLTNNSARYFLKHYLEAKAKGQTRKLINFERAISGLQTHPYFKRGFEFNPRLRHKSTALGVTLHGEVQSLPDEIYNTYLEAEADYVSPPIIRLSNKNLLNAINDAAPEIEATPTTQAEEEKTMLEPTTPHGQSEVEYSQPTQAESEAAFTVDQDPVSDKGQEEPRGYEDDRENGDERDDTSIEEFQTRWFSQPGYSSMFPETVRNFRRGFMDYLFATNAEDDARPFLRPIGQVVTTLKARAKELSATFTDDYLTSLDPVNDQADRDLYQRAVISREFPFLMRKYFPAIRQNLETKEYKYHSDRYKSRSFSDKESFNLITDGATDMVKSQLYNTPILQKLRDGSLVSTGDYVWEGDIETLVDSVKGSFDLDSIAAHMRESSNQAVQSIYYRFFHNAPYKLDGKMQWPIGSIVNPEVMHMKNSIGQFILSGQVFDLTKVDLDEGRLVMPWTAFGAPNTIREMSHQAVNEVAVNQGKFIISQDNGTMIIGKTAVSPSALKPSSDEEVLAAINALGLTTFTLDNLKEIQAEDAEKLGVIPTSPDSSQKVNNAVIDQIVIPTLRRMQSERQVTSGLRITPKLNILYNAMTRTSGVSNILSQLNVEGNRHYRLQYGAPAYRVNTQIAEVKDDPSSVNFNNLLVKGAYKIEKIPVKNGFQSYERSKVAKRFSAKESADFDIIWGFAQTLAESEKASNEYRTAALTPLVWSDSPTDPQFIVTVPKNTSFFRAPHSILGDLFESRKSFYNRHSSEILNTWNRFLEGRHKSETLEGLSRYLNSNRIPISEVERFPGMVNNLYYTSRGGNAAIKPSLLEDVSYYSGNNLADFIKKQDENFNELLKFSDSSMSSENKSMTERLGEVIEGKNGRQVLSAFYYNWLAFSSEFGNLTAGATQGYKASENSLSDRAKADTEEYIDTVKRNKLLMANRSSQLFRNQSWSALYNAAKASGVPLSPELVHEGKKLPRYAKVAYVRDVKKALSIPGPNGTRRTKNQEVYDGATFVMPTTRIMQRYSNSGNYGPYVGSVMKNVTTAIDTKRGVTTGIKNAEFLITPEIMRNGSPLIVSMVRRALSHPFSSPVQGEGAVLGNAWDYLTSKGLAEDLSNAEWSQFEDLMDYLVTHNQQDSLITEIVPDSSAKMMRGATTSLTDDQPFIPTTIDLVNKGTQVDAAHGIDEIANVSASQIINAMATNWPSNEHLMRMYLGLAEIANTKVQEFRTMTPKKRVDYLKDILQKTFSKRPDMSYASRVTSTSNSGNFSIDDRQLITSAIRNMNAELTDSAVLLDFPGGQFVVHPSNGLVQVHDVVRDGKPLTVLKSELLPAEKETPPRDLKWMRDDGYAEILLPAVMRSRFGIQPGTSLNDISPEYFYSQMEKKSRRRANQKYRDFLKVTEHLVTRIPATGKHSAVSTKVVGFINDSENSVFAPAELLFVQGADQDYDKGVNFAKGTVYDELSHEEKAASIKGQADYLWMVPEVDGTFELVGKSMYPDRVRKKARIVGIKNAITEAMMKIQSSPETLVERNSPVDVAKEELEAVAANAENTDSYRFNRDSYLSHLRMREINQAGMALRGIFSFGMKSYQVMTIAAKSKGQTLASIGVSEDPKVSERLGALVNAAVDNAKDQLMGRLGIGEHNANMVTYMVMKGMTFQEIHNQLVKYAPQMEQLKDFRRYDSKGFFDAATVWAPIPELASLYYLGNEVSRIAATTINRNLPSSDTDMIAFRKGAESFVNKQYKAFNKTQDFKLISFLENDEYAQQQVEKYETLKGRRTSGGIERSALNVLSFLKDAPHIAAYMNVYLASHNVASESKLYKTTSKLADEVFKATQGADARFSRILPELKDFTYGLFIDQYLQNAENPTDYDLASPLGRKQFVQYIGSPAYVATMKGKYPDNAFVSALILNPDIKRKWPDSTILRIPDLQQSSEERRMQMQADFAHLENDDRKALVLYNLITRHTRFGKDSFGSILSIADKADFNRFLDNRLNIDGINYAETADQFQKFRNGTSGNAAIIPHNAIPYSIGEQAKTAVQIASPKTTQATIAISQDLADFLNERLEGGGLYDTHTSVEEVLSGINTLLSEGGNTQIENAYLEGVKREITNRNSPDSKEVDDRTSNCAPR